jgi:DNA-binding response OmpR family regulator
MKILLVEDDESLIAILTKSLTSQHYVVDAVRDGEIAWTYLSTFDYDLIVLDIRLPKLDGITLCHCLRNEGITTPILLLTSQEDSLSKVEGLDAGADDYMVKPFDPSELLARIRALLRRGNNNVLSVPIWQDLVLNPSTCEVRYQGEYLSLTTKEYDLLELLLHDRSHVLSTEEILDKLWSSEEFPAEATVRSHIRRLRQKLQDAGAPEDLIGTVRGRGYYLRLPVRDRAEQPVFSSNFERSNKNINPQLQYAAFLKETWQTTKIKCLEQLKILSQVTLALQTDIFNSQYQTQARHITHKLAGTLGVFGLIPEMKMARHLEKLYDSDHCFESKQIVSIKKIVKILKQKIQDTIDLNWSNLASEHSPLLLILDRDADFVQRIVNIAAKGGIRTATAPTIEEVKIWLSAGDEPSSFMPDGILLRLRDGEELTSVKLLRELRQLHPELPILAVSQEDNLIERLKVVRYGGKFLLENYLNAEQIIGELSQLFQERSEHTKIMIVDDDRDLLATLPKLLAPWGFQIVTLTDPQQFWNVLTVTNPDALILDINMPCIDGLELCQVLRSDPHWQRLPVLFLTVFTDSQTQNRAFGVGADDYLCKPIVGWELAQRILNRLERIRIIAG